MPQTAPDASQIGAWLRRHRDTADMSIEVAAHIIGVSERTLRAWEKGKNAPPVDRFLALALLYKADVLELLARKATRSASGAESDSERKRRTG